MATSRGKSRRRSTRPLAASTTWTASRPPRFEESAISPEAVALGRFWNRWNDSNCGESPPRSSRRSRRLPESAGALAIRSMPFSLAAK